MEKAIKKAIEGEWQKEWKYLDKNDGGGESEVLFRFGHRTLNVRVEAGFDTPITKCLWIKQILLDPLFWQALGKACGWGDIMCLCNNCGHGNTKSTVNTTEICLYCGCKFPTLIRWENPWQHYWKLLIDHLAEGKSADSFFETLLAKK